MNRFISSAKHPDPEQIRKIMKNAGVTQTETARLLHVTLNTLQRWVARTEKGRTPMPLAAYELLLLKTGTMPLSVYQAEKRERRPVLAAKEIAPERRSEIARNAAQARWNKKDRLG